MYLNILIVIILVHCTLGPTQLLMQWIQEDSYSCGQKGQGVKPTTHLYLVPMSRMLELYLHSPIRFHGLVFNITKDIFNYSYFSFALNELTELS
jgi:hypothetical protein